MHPVIRLLCLIVLAALAPWLPGAALLLTAVVLLSWGILVPSAGMHMLHGMRRTRWLLLSVFVLFAWFSPGQAVFPALGRLSPTEPGLMLALERAGVLLVMVLAAIVLVLRLPRQELIAALRSVLAWPVPTHATMRFADRIGLLLAELPRVEVRVRRALHESHGQDLATRAAILFADVERVDVHQAVMEPPQPLPPVPLVQWFIPGLLLFAGIGTVFLAG